MGKSRRPLWRRPNDNRSEVDRPLGALASGVGADSVDAPEPWKASTGVRIVRSDSESVSHIDGYASDVPSDATETVSPAVSDHGSVTLAPTGAGLYSTGQPAPPADQSVVVPVSPEVTVPEGPTLQEVRQETRSGNGPIIVGEPSALNRVPWHSDGRFKLPATGRARDLDVDHGTFGDLVLCGASVRGTSHQYEGRQNEDAFATAVTEYWTVLAVSDGVSNAEYSSYTSRFLVDHVTWHLRRDLDNAGENTSVHDLLVAAMRSANNEVRDWRPGAIGAPNVDPIEMHMDAKEVRLAATLTVAIVPKTANELGERNVVVGSVGDSPAYVLHAQQWTLLTGDAPAGDITETATRSLPTRAGRELVVALVDAVLPPEAVLVLVSDGIGGPLASGRSEVGAWLARRLETPPLLAEFVDTVCFDRRSEDDDRTLLALWTPSVLRADA